MISRDGVDASAVESPHGMISVVAPTLSEHAPIFLPYSANNACDSSIRQALLPHTNEKSHNYEDTSGESPSSRQRRLANRLNLSDAQNETEKCNALFRMRRKRSSESVAETLARRRKDVERHQAERREETPEERQERLSRTAARNSVRRDSETPEERQERLSRTAATISVRKENETPEERQKRLLADAKRKSVKR